MIRLEGVNHPEAEPVARCVTCGKNCFVLAVIAPLGSIACCVGGAFTGFYSVLMNSHLYGQLARGFRSPEDSDA